MNLIRTAPRRDLQWRGAPRPPGGGRRSIGKIIFLAIVLGFIGFKGVRLAMYLFEPPGCQSDAATNGLAAALKTSFSASIAVNNGTTLSNGLLSRERRCVADVAPVRTGLDSENMEWHRVHYQVRTGEDSGLAHVTAQLGEAVPLAPERSFVTRMLASLFD